MADEERGRNGHAVGEIVRPIAQQAQVSSHLGARHLRAKQVPASDERLKNRSNTNSQRGQVDRSQQRRLQSQKTRRRELCVAAGCLRLRTRRQKRAQRTVSPQAKGYENLTALTVDALIVPDAAAAAAAGAAMAVAVPMRGLAAAVPVRMPVTAGAAAANALNLLHDEEHQHAREDLQADLEALGVVVAMRMTVMSSRGGSSSRGSVRRSIRSSALGERVAVRAAAQEIRKAGFALRTLQSRVVHMAVAVTVIVAVAVAVAVHTVVIVRVQRVRNQVQKGVCKSKR